MQKTIALLRAINVGGKAIIKMVDLKQAFLKAGCTDVVTYIQSGNVIYSAPKMGEQEIQSNIHSELHQLLGKEPSICYRRLEDFRRAVKAAPFQEMQKDNTLELYVAFLANQPNKKPKLPLHYEKEALEVVLFKNREVFVISRPFQGRYGFPNQFIEKEFGVDATTRNWKTVNKILKLAEG